MESYTGLWLPTFTWFNVLRCIHVVTGVRISFFLKLIIFHDMCVSHFIYLLICWWAYEFLSHFGYCVFNPMVLIALWKLRNHYGAAKMRESATWEHSYRTDPHIKDWQGIDRSSFRKQDPCSPAPFKELFSSNMKCYNHKLDNAHLPRGQWTSNKDKHINITKTNFMNSQNLTIFLSIAWL